MRARGFLVVVFLTVLMVPGVAHAKGPDQATVDGDGMAAPISFEGSEGKADDLSTLADVAGLWPAAYPQTPDPMLADAPKGELGPKLEITWRLPGGGPTPASVRQELYLYAEGGPLTYTPPGQPLVEGGRTTGGWFRTPTVLRPKWETLGLPSRATLEAPSRPAASPPPATSDPGPGLPAWPAVAVAIGAVLCALTVLASRGTFARRVRVGST